MHQNLFDDLVELKDNYLFVKTAMLSQAINRGMTKTANPLDIRDLAGKYALPTAASLLAYLYATSQKDPSLPAVAGLPAAAFLATQELQKSPTFAHLTPKDVLGATWGPGGPQILPLLAAAALGYLILDKINQTRTSN